MHPAVHAAAATRRLLLLLLLKLLLLLPCPARCGPHLDDAVGHVHLLAQRGQPHHHLDGVHVVRDDHHLRLAALHKVGDVVQAVLDHHRLLLLTILLGAATKGKAGSEGGEGRMVSHIRTSCQM
jgi:hypothetical protein